MAAVILQVIPSFYINVSKISLLISAHTYEKYIVSKEYCIARHDNKLCFLPICRYQIILIGDIKEFQEKLDAFCFNYQHVDCLYTLFKYRFSGNIFVKTGNCLILRRGRFISTTNTEEWTQCSALQKETLEEKEQKNC